MSHEATAWARLQKTGSTTAKFILTRLADYAGTDYSCYPSVAKLADECEMGESTVRAATKLLAEQGLIRVFYRYRSNKTRRSCRYQLMVDGPDTMEPDAEDWAGHRQISEDSHRQDLAGTPQDLADSYRQDLAVIPSKDPSLREPSPVTPGASRTSRGTRLPDDFYPDEGLQKWYAAENLGQIIDGRIEHQKFVNFWVAQPGAKGVKLDWRRTWMNWMLSAAQRAGAGPTSGAPARNRPSTGDQRVAQAQSLFEKYSQMEEEGTA